MRFLVLKASIHIQGGVLTVFSSHTVAAETPIIPELEETFETFEKSFGAGNKDFF